LIDGKLVLSLNELDTLGNTPLRLLIMMIDYDKNKDDLLKIIKLLIKFNGNISIEDIQIGLILQ
jgi:hypothetical protein